MSTPRLPTYIKAHADRREQSMQTAFPAKVISWDASANTVELEPQFIEAWVTRDGTRTTEPDASPYIGNVPVCYPWHMTWDITVGAFGLVICTKYSLDLWRQQLRRMDPGDLRRFGMSGATFHPVVIGESPNLTQKFVALAEKIDAFFDAYVNATAVAQDGGEAIQTTVATVWNGTTDSVASTTVKVSE